MLRPSYTDLPEVINKSNDDSAVTSSRYSIVIAAAKRARQLIDNAEPLVEVTKDNKPVSIAVNELYQGKLKIIENGDIVCGDELCQKQAEEAAAAEEDAEQDENGDL